MMPNTKSPEPTAVLSDRLVASKPGGEGESFGAKADGAFVSRQVGIPVTNLRWLGDLL